MNHHLDEVLRAMDRFNHSISNADVMDDLAIVQKNMDSTASSLNAHINGTYEELNHVKEKLYIVQAGA